MNKKLQSLILSALLSVFMTSTYIFSNTNEEKLIIELTKEFESENTDTIINKSIDDVTDDTTTEEDYDSNGSDESTEAITEEEPIEETIEEELIMTPWSTRVPINDANKNLIYNGSTIKNAHTGDFWVNSNYNGRTNDGIIQRMYVDHIDVKIDNVTVTVHYYENGQYVNSIKKQAQVLNVKDILINGQTYSYYSTGHKRKDGVLLDDEFNFQIAELDTFNYETEWLNLYNVNSITIIADLVVYENNKAIPYNDVHFTIEGTYDIVKKSYCTNASGLDYHLSGDISDFIEIELPSPEPEQEIDFNIATLVPKTGDVAYTENWLCILLILIGLRLLKYIK